MSAENVCSRLRAACRSWRACGAPRARFASIGFVLSVALWMLLVAPVSAQDTLTVPDSAALAAAGAGQTVSAGPVQDSVRPAPVPIVLGGDTLGFLYGPSGLRDPEVRVEDLLDRLLNLRLDGVSPDSVRIDSERSPPVVTVSGEPILVVTPAEIAAQGVAPDSALAIYARIVRNALELPLFRGSPRDLAIAIGLLLLSTVLLFWLWRALARLQPSTTDFLKRHITARISSIRIQRFEIMSRADIERLISAGVWLLRITVSIAVVAFYIPLVFSFFPTTRPIATRLFAVVLRPLQAAGIALLDYLPNVFMILVIVFITWRALILVRGFFLALERGRIQFSGFYPDWGRPTYQLLRVLMVAFAVVLVWEYLPKSDSTAFQGVAAFLGLLVTFGSAGAVSNAVGGVVMVYMRPFQPGDRVQIADTMGDVEERGILVTRIRTPKNVVVTIPNSQVLGSHMINYSRVARESGIILHTAVTIGYDVPWPKVHEALLGAARKVEGILESPGPFILQTALGDFTVSYELNAHTREPERMGMLYSDLHREIQTEFAKAGIEITSPHFYSIRDGNRSTIPEASENETPVTDEVRGEEPEAS